MKNLVLTLLAIIVLSSCGDRNANRDSKVLTVSIEPQRQLLEAIIGDKFEVHTLLPPGANPETFEVTLRARRDVDGSRAFFSVGQMPFELSVIKTLPEGITVVDCSRDIEPIFGTHDHHHDHDKGDPCKEDHHEHSNIDPHTWTSVKNMRKMAASMLSTVIQLDPDNADYYKSRHQALDESLKALDDDIASRLEGADVRAFAVWHPSLSYFARDYGLEQIAVGFENKELSPTRMAEVIENARRAGVKTLFYQQQYDSRQVESLNSSLGAQIVTFNPLDYDWQKQLRNITHALETQRGN